MSSNDKSFTSYRGLRYTPADMLNRSRSFYQLLEERRSLRMFSDKEVPLQVMENIIMAASTAPSGAHKQPWSFCLVSNPGLKAKIRKAAEAEEYENYHGRMSEEWLADLQPFDTNWHKPFLETAPYLIVLFKKAYDLDDDGQKSKNYYVNESVGIAAGFLLTAIHYAGLVALTHTPSPMNFLRDILERPANERPFLLIPVGYPAKDAKVPVLERKSKEDILFYYGTEEE